MEALQTHARYHPQAALHDLQRALGRLVHGAARQCRRALVKDTVGFARVIPADSAPCGSGVSRVIFVGSLRVPGVFIQQLCKSLRSMIRGLSGAMWSRSALVGKSGGDQRLLFQPPPSTHEPGPGAVGFPFIFCSASSFEVTPSRSTLRKAARVGEEVNMSVGQPGDDGLAARVHPARVRTHCRSHFVKRTDC